MKLISKDILMAKRIKLEFLPDFKEERTQKFTTLVLTLVALSFFGLVAINPTISTIIKLNKELEDSQLVDRKLTEKINNITSLQQSYTAIEKDLPFVFAAIPKSAEVPLFAAQVQAVADNSNTTIDSLQTFEVNVSNVASARGFSAFTFALVAEGSYNDLKNFLDNLSNMQRVVGIDILSLTKKTGGTSLQLTLKGETYFSP